ncbi:PH domain-containing protein [Pleurostoma richardsiae]|uniref:PH domain-containing protein n=1 Tax=Pleurostoma richardsiae TaxID=41990 RepID=A0AA38REN9_9PEZI|nr:PH domain-containing protein [Pleurostoma richardsiae]
MASPQSESSVGSFHNQGLDDAAFTQVHPLDMSRQRTPQPEGYVQRQGTQRSQASSHYDDASSTTSPDYASTRKSSETQDSMERPRAGVLRTVGDQEHQERRQDPASGFGIPQINFGPTLNYGSPNLPHSKTPTGMTPPAPLGAQFAQRPYSPVGPRRPTGVASPGPAEHTHQRQESDDTIRRSVAWQPGVAVSAARDGALSPEEFVQQRAAAAAAPLYAHQRTPSGNTVAQPLRNTPTPPLKRTGSQDYLNGLGGDGNGRHSRSGSVDVLQRPSSQGSTNVLGRSGSGDFSSHLSAREQEHLARATGSPLISMAGNSRPAQNGGLVGAIEARERERAQMKQGVSSQAVQHAINQRQQQQQQMYGGPQNMGMGNSSNMGQAMGLPSPSAYGNPTMFRGQGPPSQRPPPLQNVGYGPPQSYASPMSPMSPMSGPYAQAGGFSRPLRPQGTSPHPGQQGGYYGPPPQGRYSPAPRPGTPGTPGNMGPLGQGTHPYQGQAF